jgi:dUTP pyrophosphatase
MARPTLKQQPALAPAPAPVSAPAPTPLPPLQLGVKLLDPSAKVPAYQTAGAACFDLHAVNDVIIRPGQQKMVKTGLAFEIPARWVMMVYSRSGHGAKHSVRLANCVGVIDSDYRGEVMVTLRNDGDEAFHVWAGERVAQAMLSPARPVEISVLDELSETARGAGGMGSTGA